MTIFLILLLATAKEPPLYCTEVAIELQRGVEIGVITDKEAVAIYNRCVSRAP